MDGAGTQDVLGALALVVLEENPDGVVVLDSEWIYRYANPAAAAALGTSVEALLGQNYRVLYPEAVNTTFGQAYARVMTTGVTEEVDDYYEPWEKYFRNRIVAYSSGIVITFTDVTEERRGVNALKHSRELLRQVVDSAPVGIVLQDVEDRYLLVNRFSADRTGRPAEDIVGRRPEEVLPSALAKEFRAETATVRAQGKSLHVGSAVIASAEEQYRYVRVVFPIFDGSERLLGTGTVYTDVTKLDQAEADLAEANEVLRRFQALVEASDDFIAMAHIGGAMMYVNPAGRALVGMDPSTDVRATTISDYLTPEANVVSSQGEQRVAIEQGRWAGEATLRDWRGGPPIAVAASTFVITDPRTGDPFALATVRRDIRERKAAQDALDAAAAQRQQLLARLVDAQEQERARIAADVHDDPVQALAAAELRLGLLARRLSEVDQQWSELVGQVQEAVAGAAGRLRHLLFDLESLQEGDSVVDALQQAAAFVFEDTATSWTVEGELDVDLPHAVSVTAVRIAKEALGNVRRHASASSVLISVRHDADGVSFDISDDGVGLGPLPLRARPGHRGVITMQDRAQLAGGWCRLEPRPKGAAVVFWLPGSASVG